MDAADARPEHVAGAQEDRLAVGERLDLALEDVVRLLERMVVRLRDAAGLVLHHEHRVQHGAEPLVDEHLQRDAAVGEQRRGHARRDGGGVDGRAELAVLELHLAGVEAEERARARIADVESAPTATRPQLRR